MSEQFQNPISSEIIKRYDFLGSCFYIKWLG